MRMIAAIALFILINPNLSCGQTFPYRDKVDFVEGAEKGEITIELANSKLRKNDLSSVRYTFHVINGSYAVYNWQFIRLLPLPGQLVIYDKNKKYIGDLIQFTGGSQRGISDNDWTFLYGESFLGKPIGFRAGLVPGTQYDSLDRLLPVGTYYIQLVLYKAFRATNPSRVVGEPIDFYKTFDRTELCRSNVIKIALVDP